MATRAVARRQSATGETADAASSVRAHGGEIADREKSAFLSGAIALLMPIDWPEPFGLVMIEAMACGTPSIVFDRGAVREIIEDGLTGWTVNSGNATDGAVLSTTADAYSGSGAAQVTNRKTTGSGPAQDLAGKVAAGKTYTVTAATSTASVMSL